MASFRITIASFQDKFAHISEQIFHLTRMIQDLAPSGNSTSDKPISYRAKDIKARLLRDKDDKRNKRKHKGIDI